MEIPNFVALNKLAIYYADAVVLVGNKINKKILKYINTLRKPILTHPEKRESTKGYDDLYEALFQKVKEAELELTS